MLSNAHMSLCILSLSSCKFLGTELSSHIRTHASFAEHCHARSCELLEIHESLNQPMPTDAVHRWLGIHDNVLGALRLKYLESFLICRFNSLYFNELQVYINSRPFFWNDFGKVVLISKDLRNDFHYRRNIYPCSATFALRLGLSSSLKNI